MTQQNIFPEAETDSSKILNKISLLYLIEKMGIPMTKNQIEEFALGEGLMNLLTVTRYLSELAESGYLDLTQENNLSRYSITDEGLLSLELFQKELSQVTKNKVLRFVTENGKKMKQDFQITANYFYEHKYDEYTVKCTLYDDDKRLMEITVSVVNKEQAVSICNNWKNNVSTLYGQALDLILTKDKQEDLQTRIDQ